MKTPLKTNFRKHKNKQWKTVMLEETLVEKKEDCIDYGTDQDRSIKEINE